MSSAAEQISSSGKHCFTFTPVESSSLLAEDGELIPTRSTFQTAIAVTPNNSESDLCISGNGAKLMVGKGYSQDAFISSNTKLQSSAENSDLEDNVQLQKDEQFSRLQDTFVSKERPLYSQLQLNSAPTLKSMKASQVLKDCNGGVTVDEFQLDPRNTVAEAWEDDGKKDINANPKGSMDNPPAVLSGRGNISNLNLNSNSHGLVSVNQQSMSHFLLLERA